MLMSSSVKVVVAKGEETLEKKALGEVVVLPCSLAKLSQESQLLPN